MEVPLGDCTVTVVVNQLPMDPTVKGRLFGKGLAPKCRMHPGYRGRRHPQHVFSQYAQEDCSHR